MIGGSAYHSLMMRPARCSWTTPSRTGMCSLADTRAVGVLASTRTLKEAPIVANHHPGTALTEEEIGGESSFFSVPLLHRRPF